MEETHQEVVLKLREDMKREEEKHISRAVAQVRSEEEEKQHEGIQQYYVTKIEALQVKYTVVHIDRVPKIVNLEHGC